MSLLAKESGTSYAIAPVGNHAARCIQVIDLGTSINEKFGSKSRKVRLSWELPNEMFVFDETKGEQPYIVSKELTLSLNSKANLRKFLESWRGKAFTSEELDGFDVLKLLGAPCMLNVIHDTSATGKNYATIAAVTPIAKGMSIPKAINPLISLTLDENFDPSAFQNLPDFLKEKIQQSDEFNAMKGAIPSDNETDELPF